jgi:hypothetical protein
MSTIRHLVNVHHECVGITQWSGSSATETSDIVYADHSWTLTNLLLAKGYLNGTRFSNNGSRSSQSPTYYIEVKATPSELNVPLFCSQLQVNRMESMELDADHPENNIYIIARVYQLGVSGMGLKLYMDPARLRRTGELKFETKTYAVTPR